MDDMEFEQRVEYIVRDKSHVAGEKIFDVVHSESRSVVLYVTQLLDYVDNSKIIFDTTGKKLFKMRRDQGLPVMPMYMHDYRNKTEYKWKSRDIYPAQKNLTSEQLKGKHTVTINTAPDKLSYDIVDKHSGKTIAWVSIHEQTEVGVCSYKVSANSEADIPFIITLVISVDERYMGMVRLKNSASSAHSCVVQ